MTTVPEWQVIPQRKSVKQFILGILAWLFTVNCFSFLSNQFRARTEPGISLCLISPAILLVAGFVATFLGRFKMQEGIYPFSFLRQWIENLDHPVDCYTYA